MGAYEYCGEEEPNPAPPLFQRGDTNADATIEIADAIFTLTYLFAEGSPPTCLDTADTNDNGAVDIADAIFTLQYLFVEGAVIPQPYPVCGVDPTEDELGCSSYPPCD